MVFSLKLPLLRLNRKITLPWLTSNEVFCDSQSHTSVVEAMNLLISKSEASHSPTFYNYSLTFPSHHLLVLQK